MHPRQRFNTLLVWLLLLFCAGGAGPLLGRQIEEATIFQTYGYRSGARWVIPMRIWVHEPRTVTQAAVTGLAAADGDRPAAEIARFRDRLSDLVADDESREQVAFVFDQDPRQEPFTLREADGTPKRSDLNGLILGELSLTTGRVQELLKA